MAVTVKILSGNPAMVKPAEDEKAAEEKVHEKEQNENVGKIKFFDYPVPVRRRKRLSFGAVLVIQAITALVIAAAVWSGTAFGDENLRQIISAAVNSIT